MGPRSGCGIGGGDTAIRGRAAPTGSLLMLGVTSKRTSEAAQTMGAQMRWNALGLLSLAC